MTHKKPPTLHVIATAALHRQINYTQDIRLSLPCTAHTDLSCSDHFSTQACCPRSQSLTALQDQPHLFPTLILRHSQKGEHTRPSRPPVYTKSRLSLPCTAQTESSCSDHSCTQACCPRSHSRTALPPPPLTRWEPSFENLRPRTLAQGAEEDVLPNAATLFAPTRSS